MVFLLRQLLITLPAAFVLSRVFGLAGIWASFFLAESTAAVVSVVFYRHLRRTDPVLQGEEGPF